MILYNIELLLHSQKDVDDVEPIFVFGASHNGVRELGWQDSEMIGLLTTVEPIFVFDPKVFRISAPKNMFTKACFHTQNSMVPKLWQLLVLSYLIYGSVSASYSRAASLTYYESLIAVNQVIRSKLAQGYCQTKEIHS